MFNSRISAIAVVTFGIVLFVSRLALSSFTFQNESYARGSHVEYRIQEGRLFERAEGTAEWKLQGGVGLPYAQQSRQVFPWIRSLKRVYADADCILVSDQDDRVYFYQSTPVLIGARQPYAWDIHWGQPIPRPLHLKSSFRAVAFARHTDASLKFMEDALGIPHNAGGDSYLINWHREKKGHSGLTHIYALSEDGSRLFFGDSGLPSGISYEYPLPRARQGNPVAIASRGSVVAILTDRGEVFTKLLDFDFLGHNPMMYGYRYNPQSLIEELRPFHFTDLTPSHYGTINLPYPDWQKHEVNAGEGLELGSAIDMETTGPGIHNRELFLQFKDKKGDCGILRKTFAESVWRREDSETCPGEMLSQRLTPRSTQPSYYFSGNLKIAGKSYPFEITDFDLVNYEAYATIEVDGVLEPLKLHTVFTWSPFGVESPGFDGRPKLFHVTFEFPDGAVLPGELLKLQRESFSAWLWGTKDHLKLQSRNGKLSGSFFNEANRNQTHFIPAYGEELNLESLHKRLNLAHFERRSLYTMKLGIKASRTMTSMALMPYWPRAMDATFPPLPRLLTWGREVVKQRLKILDEEIGELRKMVHKAELRGRPHAP